MLKIIVVSDSHGEVLLLKKLLQKHNDAQYFFHLGDSELTPSQLDGFLSVRGNCDFYEFPKYLDLDLPFGMVHLEHGNNSSFRNENVIKEKGYKLFLSGHTHIKSEKKIGDCYLLNPGSLTYPRDDSYGSYLIIEYENDNFKFTFEYVDSLY